MTSTLKNVVSSALALFLAACPAMAQTRLQLRWEIKENLFRGQDDEGRSRATFTLVNKDALGLPASGWGLYFNCLDGVETGPLKGNLILERVGGCLFRLVPGPGFPGLAPGQALKVDFTHASLVSLSSMAPAGPYLVFAKTPDQGFPIADYVAAPMVRPEQVAKGPKDPQPRLTPQAIFQKNLDLAELPLALVPPVFPTPLKLVAPSGTLHFAQLPEVTGPASLQNELALAKAMLSPYLPPSHGDPATQSTTPKVRLEVARLEGQDAPEAYELSVTPGQGILVRGQTAAGVFYGLQSLRELLPLAADPAKGLDLAALALVDAPRFGYRGFQLDVARNFQPKATVKKILDLMARYKLNTFHFHLTDDEGWRLEIPGLPELTGLGAHRGLARPGQDCLPPAYGSGPDQLDPHGSGFYSRAEFLEILRYAADRHITVIPELEMPGHARAALKAMASRCQRLERAGDPQARQYLLNDPDDQSVYLSPQFYTDHVINPALPSTYAFIEKVVTEVVALYKEAGVPLATVHMGGDELPKGAWEKSPACLALMKAKGFTSVGQLWDTFYDQVDQILKRQGLRVSGWEELATRRIKGEGELAMPNPLFTQRGFQVWVWNDVGDGAENLAYRLANAGYQTVLAPATRFYLDMAYNKNPEEPGVNWANTIELDTVFDYIPFDYLKTTKPELARAKAKDGLTAYGEQRILGLEACIWSETIRPEERLEYLVMPRLLAFAERAWAADPAWAREQDPARAAALHQQAWSTFANVVGKRVLPRLDADHAGVQYRIPPPGLKLEGGKVLCNLQLPGFTLRYTVDGSEPTSASPQVTGPIAAKGTIKVAAFNGTGRGGASSTIAN